MPESEEGEKDEEEQQLPPARATAVVVCQALLSTETNEDGDNLITKTVLS